MILQDCNIKLLVFSSKKRLPINKYRARTKNFRNKYK